MKKKITISNRSKIAVLLLALFLMTTGATGIYAASNHAVNNVDTGVVNIEISEYTLNPDGEEVPWVDNVSVLPGMTVSKIPYFTSTGIDCYIRAKVEINGIVEGATPITDEDINGISDDWIKIGEYYYYPNILKTNESVDFFHGFKIPHDWNDDVNPSNIGDWGFSVDVTVDAVQAENFTPNFKSESPWGDIDIQESIHKNDYDINSFTTSTDTNMFIVIEDYNNIVVDPEDFFGGFKTLVPGDTMVDSVEINSSKNCELYFSTESLEDLDLLQKLTLKIVLNKSGEEKVIYDGVLDSQINRQSLGKFGRGETGTLTFTVSVPVELDNQYTLRNGTVKWIFETKTDGSSDIPQTGDSNMVIVYVIMMICGAALLIMILPLSHKENRKDNYEKKNRKCN
jgi:hypothetical protein